MEFILLNKKVKIEKKLNNYTLLYKQFIPLKNVAYTTIESYIKNYNNYQHFPNDLEAYFKKILLPAFDLIIKICDKYKISNLSHELLFNLSLKNKDFDSFYTLYNDIVRSYESIAKIEGVFVSHNDNEEIFEKVRSHFRHAIDYDQLATTFKNTVIDAFDNLYKTFIYTLLPSQNISIFNFEFKTNEVLEHKLFNNLLQDDKSTIVQLLESNPFNEEVYFYVIKKYPANINEIIAIAKYFAVDLSEGLKNIVEAKNSSTKDVHTPLDIRNKVVQFYKSIPKNSYQDMIICHGKFIEFLRNEQIDSNLEFVTYIVNDINKKLQEFDPSHLSSENAHYSESDVQNFFKNLPTDNMTNIKESIVKFEEFCEKYNISLDLKDTFMKKLKRIEYEKKHNIYKDI